MSWVGWKKNKKYRVGLKIPDKRGSSSILVKISYFVLIRKIGMIKNRLILTGIFIEMGVVDKNVSLIYLITKSYDEPNGNLIIQVMGTIE